MKNKKSVFFLFGMIILAVFASCTKENEEIQDTEYNPGKKIQKVYKTYSTNDEKQLIEVWHWNQNRLESIDYYSQQPKGDENPSVEKFTYEDDRVVRIDIDNANNPNYTHYTLFNYENNVLESVNEYEIRTYVDNFWGIQITDTTKSTYILSYQDEKLSQVVYDRSHKKAQPDDKISPEVFHLIWEGDNLIEINDGKSPMYLFEYDNNTNPMYGRLNVSYFSVLMGNWTDCYNPFISKNNCTQVMEDMHKDGTYSIGYLYDEDGYPTKQMRGTQAFYYEYE